MRGREIDEGGEIDKEREREWEREREKEREAPRSCCKGYRKDMLLSWVIMLCGVVCKW